MIAPLANLNCTAIARFAVVLGLCNVLLLPAGSAWAMKQLRENFYTGGDLKTRWEVELDEHLVLRDGSFRRFHPGGKLALQAYYRRSERVGTWTWYDLHGNVMRRVRFEDGEQITLDKGEFMQAEHVFRDTAGRIVATGMLKFDKPHGEWKYFYADGTTKAKGGFVSGVADGIWIHYHHNGQIIRRETYRLGILHGLYRNAYDNGQDTIRGLYDWGVKTGLWRRWYPNGQLREQGYYGEDKREGEWRFYADDGAILRRSVYRVDTQIYDLPLPSPKVAMVPVIPDPFGLPFIPRLYDESDQLIQRFHPE